MLMREGKATAKPTKSLKETEWSSGFDVLQEMLQCTAAKTGHLMNREREDCQWDLKGRGNTRLKDYHYNQVSSQIMV
jgi:hypothetical protein